MQSDYVARRKSGNMKYKNIITGSLSPTIAWVPTPGDFLGSKIDWLDYLNTSKNEYIHDVLKR